MINDLLNAISRRLVGTLEAHQGRVIGALIVFAVIWWLWKLKSLVVRLVCVMMALVAIAGALSTPLPDKRQIWVGLGDSYSAGTGESDGRGCAQSSVAYDFQAASIMNVSQQTVDLDHKACAGATTQQFYAAQGLSRTQSVPRQLSDIGPSTDIVSLTIGGNDVGFGDDVEGCILGRCRPGLLTDDQTLVLKDPQPNDRKAGSAWDKLYSRLVGLYVETRKKIAPSGHMYVLTYPIPFARPQDWKKHTCNGSIDPEEAAAANRYVARLGDTIYQAVQDANRELANEGRAGRVRFVDWRTPQRAFDQLVGKTVIYNPQGLCGTQDPMVHGVDIKSIPFSWINTYHPTTHGYQIVASRLAAAMRADGVRRKP